MNSQERAAAKKRSEAATPGPWKCFNAFNWRDKTVVERFGTQSQTVITRGNQGNDLVGRYEDWEFIAWARADVPALLSENDRLREMLKAATCVLFDTNVEKQVCTLCDVKRGHRSDCVLGRALDLLEATK